MSQFQLGALKNGAIVVEIVSTSVAIIDSASKAEGEKAIIGVRLARGLTPNKAALGYRVVSKNQVVKRTKISGNKLQWKDAETYWMGTKEISIPKAAILQCIASYDGIAQHHYWVGDATTAQNSRRAAYETYDRRLEKLQEILMRENSRGQDARDFEAAIAWLLWILGFGVVHLSATRSSDGPDLIATAPSGHIVVVECTTGLLKTDNKLPQLYERAQAMRRSLDASGNSHVRVLPLMVTAKKRGDVVAELEQAERHGVLVLARENIESALARSLILPDADRLYAEGEQEVRNALDKFVGQRNLPFRN
jgi:hypothetical protein